MSKYIPGNQKHLTLDDRIYIQNELSKGTSFKDIARFLCKGSHYHFQRGESAPPVRLVSQRYLL